MDYVFKLYQYQLINCDEAYDIVLNRVCDPLILDEFEIGLAGSYNELTKELMLKYNEQMLARDLHLLRISEKTKEHYDTFKERITFPIRDEFGNAVGLGGWAMFHNEAKEKQKTNPSEFVPAKYINSSSSKLFNKSEVVYNLHRAIPTIKKLGFVYLAEGYFDVTAIHASCRTDGIFRQNVVSSMGTSITRGQAEIIRTYTDKIVICYDGDSAGREAALKAIPILKKAGLKIRIVILPKQHDPDSYFKEHDMLDILDDNRFNVAQFKFLMWYEEVSKINNDTQASFKITKILKEFPAIMKGQSRTTINPLVAVMAIDMDTDEVLLSLDLCIVDPQTFAFPYLDNVMLYHSPRDMETYLINAFGQNKEYLDTITEPTIKDRKEKIAYEKVYELWKQSNS